MGLWAKSLVIFNALREHGKQSIRSLADRIGLSKSSVHRHLQAIDRRDRYPESSLWETKAGRTWLIRLVVATLFVFGFKRGVGAETLSEFFGRLRLEAHVGCSPSALRCVMHTLERLILETTAAWEKEGIAHGEIRPVIGAVDETFLQRMMLVFMDLATGYLLMEEVAADRCFETWYDGVNERLTTFGTEVLYVVSDRAKALIKLAHTGLGCLSIPDLFHLSHDLAKGYALAIFGRLRQAQQVLEHARQRLETLQKNTQAGSMPGSSRSQALGRGLRRPSVARWQGVRSAWKEQPFQCVAHRASLAACGRKPPDVTGGRTSSCDVEIQAIETLLETQRVADEKGHLGQGSQAACWRLGPGRFLVADGASGLGADSHDPEMDTVG